MFSFVCLCVKSFVPNKLEAFSDVVFLVLKRTQIKESFLCLSTNFVRDDIMLNSTL